MTPLLLLKQGFPGTPAGRPKAVTTAGVATTTAVRTLPAIPGAGLCPYDARTHSVPICILYASTVSRRFATFRYAFHLRLSPDSTRLLQRFMDTWTPLFSKIVDSSLWLEPDHVRIVFITLLAKKDADFVVRGSAFNIAQWSKKTEKEVVDALRRLSSPDKKRLEPQPHEGRRIQKVEDGWLILNGKYYRELMVAANERARKRRWAAQKRAQEREERKANRAAEKHGPY